MEYLILYIILIVFLCTKIKKKNNGKKYHKQTDNYYYRIQKDKKTNEEDIIQQSYPFPDEYDEYFKVTHSSYHNIVYDRGKVGEYKLYLSLKNLPGYKKFLFNCYLPKYNMQKTEIDIIMLHRTGIYVFESKNYSGWIFGNENQEKWTQTLYVKYKGTQKNHFFNPISQNNVHIK